MIFVFLFGYLKWWIGLNKKEEKLKVNGCNSNVGRFLVLFGKTLYLLLTRVGDWTEIAAIAAATTTVIPGYNNCAANTGIVVANIVRWTGVTTKLATNSSTTCSQTIIIDVVVGSGVFMETINVTIINNVIVMQVTGVVYDGFNFSST